MNRILVHTCCGPCLTYPLLQLSKEEYEVSALFFNPNIHPVQEAKSRLKCFRELCEQGIRVSNLLKKSRASSEENSALTIRSQKDSIQEDPATELNQYLQMDDTIKPKRCISIPEYDIVKWLRNIVCREESSVRCRLCYYQRLHRTALIAKKSNYDAFTTTLLVSPFQKHAIVKDLGSAISEEVGIPFLYKDFRVGWKLSRFFARELGLYLQQYCGCIYSEEDRFRSLLRENEDKRISSDLQPKSV